MAMGQEPQQTVPLQIDQTDKLIVLAAPDAWGSNRKTFLSWWLAIRSFSERAIEGRGAKNAVTSSCPNGPLVPIFARLSYPSR